ncbi:MAG: signal peptidase I [Clostridium sp.]|nr:signal peptidase I [Clostridium sp.]
MRKQIVKIVLNIVFYLVLAFLVFISFMGFYSYKSGKQPEILGYKFYVVLTGSMVPTINPGDLVIVKNVPADEIKVDDVITFGSENIKEVTTHRVKEIKSNENLEFVTKGDANNVEDPAPIKSTLLQGKVVKCIPKVGSALKFLKENMVIIIVSIILIITFITLTFKLIKKTNKVNKESDVLKNM